MVFSATMRMFCKHGSPSTIRRLLIGEYVLEPVVWPMSCSAGGMIEPYVYMHC